VPRLLRLFDEYDMRTTWCIPSHTLRTFPRQCADIVERGHEIAAHGCYHEHNFAVEVNTQPWFYTEANKKQRH
jgi:peptidoglycan/xylan/chitin deacetylase (PgdA/CDA1 family)